MFFSCILNSRELPRKDLQNLTVSHFLNLINNVLTKKECIFYTNVAAVYFKG